MQIRRSEWVGLQCSLSCVDVIKMHIHEQGRKIKINKGRGAKVQKEQK
jgi:hypothetical protein